MRVDGEGHLTFGLFFEKWDNPGGKAQLRKAAMQPAVGKGDPGAILCMELSLEVLDKSQGVVSAVSSLSLENLVQTNSRKTEAGQLL